MCAYECWGKKPHLFELSVNSRVKSKCLIQHEDWNKKTLHKS